MNLSSSLTRSEVVAALIRHPDWGLEPAHPKDVWALAAGETLPAESSAVIDARVQNVDRALAIEDEYRQLGIWVLTFVDHGYPRRLRERLGKRAPGLLYGFGPEGLLAEDGIGVVGSRNIDRAGEKVAAEAAQAIAEGKRTLVSGGARGVDQISMREALRCDGKAVGVLSESLCRASCEGDNQELVELGRLCLITPFQPDMGFTVANAMARNKLIYALTDCTLVVAADLETGGSWAGATEALRHQLSHVAVWAGEGSGGGNQALIEKGALPVMDPEQILDQDWLTSEAARLEPQQQFDFGEPA